jgi:hypothetical protein
MHSKSHRNAPLSRQEGACEKVGCDLLSNASKWIEWREDPSVACGGFGGETGLNSNGPFGARTIPQSLEQFEWLYSRGAIDEGA